MKIEKNKDEKFQFLSKIAAVCKVWPQKFFWDLFF